jgi:hypothetical protein
MSSLRTLTFTNWDEVQRDLEQLLRGYEQHGNWNLAQTALHLNDWMTYPLDGYPKPSWFWACVFTCLRTIAGKRILKQTLEEGFKLGTPTLPATVHSATEAADAEAVEKLRKTIDRFRHFQGELHASPLYGALDYPTGEQLQLRHFAHHLRFLKPTAENAAA